MKVSAIICEYNPLHNGHVHHIRETRRNGATHILAILSSNFVQRGDTALLDKFDRAQLALRAGADLVMELPTVFSCAAAKNYATGAVTLLHSLGIADELSFGSSAGDMAVLQQLTDAALSAAQHMSAHLKAGCSYPAALWEAVREQYGSQLAAALQDPNNLLAVEYLKAIRRTGAAFRPFTIPRNAVMHDSNEPIGNYASATYVRRCVLNGSRAYLDFVPSCTAELIETRTKQGRTASLYRMERAVLYRMRTITEEELLRLPDMTDSLCCRFLAARHSSTLDALFATVKTRCYTMSRIRRAVMCAMIGIDRNMPRTAPPYARVLAFNDRGCELLGIARRNSRIPVHTSLARLRDSSPVSKAFVELEERASDVYGLARQEITSSEEDFRARIVKEKLL